MIVPNLPEGPFPIIYADPPWAYRDSGCRGAAEGHYKTTHLDDLCDLPVGSIAADNAVLFMWGTYPLLPDALKLGAAWGFEYKTLAFQWVKTYSDGVSFFWGTGSG